MGNLSDRIASGSFTLIAEVGVNYYDIAVQRGLSNMDAAKLMCREASDAGVHAVKFQSYKAETLAASVSPSYWDTNEEPTTSQRELFKKYDSFGEAEYQELAEYCNGIGVEFCSTAFDFESADYLEPLMSVYKISSSDLTNIPFIEYQAAKGKPVIMSVGAGDVYEMRTAVEAVRRVNNQPLVLMHCVLEYPTPYNHANLRRIRSLANEFPDVLIGYSDHCKPDESADVIKLAYAMGAHVIEKHFTLDKALPGNDHYHAMDPNDARNILKAVGFAETLLGKPELVFSDSEASARLNARRSIVSAVDIPAGTVLTREMLTFKRPGTGISPVQLDRIVGCTATVDIPEDTTLMENMVDSRIAI